MNSPKSKPSSPCFSSGPTRKPEGWSLNIIKKEFLGRYHRAKDTKIYINSVLQKIKTTLNIPNQFKLFLMPGSCTGAMEAVIWSLLGNRDITSIVYDFWADEWNSDLKKLNVKIDCRKCLDGKFPDTKNIPKENDVIFVWTGTSNGMSIPNTSFLSKKQIGLVVCDITSAAFIYDIPWKKIDISVFSWQKALGSESQHGIIVMSPKAHKYLGRKLKQGPKILDLNTFDYLVNTPSLLVIADLELCLDLYLKRGGLEGNKSICIENKKILDNWEKQSKYVEYFSKNKKTRALTPCYFIFKKKYNTLQLFEFLFKNKIAFDIESYRKAKPGIRIWTGPTIKKKDLIALTNWLDWSFDKFLKDQ